MAMLDEDDDDSEFDAIDNITVPGFFVLLILLSFATITAVAFTYWEPWDLFNSFYFTFITMVTVGFGDMVPRVEEYYPLSIFFIFAGLVLTTMCIDLVGSDYIDRVHYFGTHMQNARAALAALGDRAGKLNWLRNLRGSLSDPNYIALLLSNRVRIVAPFSPTLSNLKYIDAFSSGTDLPVAHSLSSTARSNRSACEDNTARDVRSARSAQSSENSTLMIRMQI